MKSRRPARTARSLWARIAGYTGTLALVAAAVIVLLMPLTDDGGKGAAGAQGTAGPSAPAGGAPNGSGLPATPTNPVPQQDGSGPAVSAGQDGGGSGGQGGGPVIPTQGSGGIGWCPKGTAFYKATATGVDVVVTVASSGAIRAELSLRGREPQSQQTTVRSGGPHAFHFKGVAPQLVERVKVNTVSVGVAMQTCYARAGT
ncbi:hypothetical protein [Actinomadura madurae]|uniref:hypothetical protein n=1 Tax=Actinomadura madurae TaxID=1993 RepID=UPI0020D2136E|nr:hypothetical protein [Actinomadura madurae]MCQ0012316.1 hypothetical protein [Actinomadura madurae]